MPLGDTSEYLSLALAVVLLLPCAYKAVPPSTASSAVASATVSMLLRFMADPRVVVVDERVPRAAEREHTCRAEQWMPALDSRAGGGRAHLRARSQTIPVGKSIRRRCCRQSLIGGDPRLDSL